MKFYKFPLKISLIFSLLLVTANVGRTQSGNFSDITGPITTEFPPPEPETAPEPPGESSPARESDNTFRNSEPVQAAEPINQDSGFDNSLGNEPINNANPTTNGNDNFQNTNNNTNQDPGLDNNNQLGSNDDAGAITNGERDFQNTNNNANQDPGLDNNNQLGSNDDAGAIINGERESTTTSDNDSNPDINREDDFSNNTESRTSSNSEQEVESNTDSNLDPETDTNTTSADADSQTNTTDSQSTEEQTAEETQQNETEASANSEEEVTTDTDSENETTADIDSEEEVEANADSEEETTADADSEEEAEASAESEEEEEVAEKEDETEEKQEEAERRESAPKQVDRLAYETQLQQADTSVAIQLQEEFQVTQLVSSSGVQLYGQLPSVEQISNRLGQLWQQTGQKPAFINVSVQSNQLETFAVLPTLADTAESNNPALTASKNNSKGKISTNNVPQTQTLRQTVKSSSRREILSLAKTFREEVSNSRNIGKSNYLESAQQLYQLIIKPLEASLEANDVDVLVFSMDSGLRLIPIAALHDGQQFLVEKYAVALVPSFGLTDTRYVDIHQSPILAMGASQFQDQAPLPTMPLELRNITRNPRQGEVFLDDQFTIDNFITQNRRSDPFRIIHLGTHAQFKAGEFDDSFIQFSDRKLKLRELRKISDELGWSTNSAAPIELLVLSACQTAIGDEQAELGFAGLAVQAGVKSALASLWYISDLGTLALMGEFYDQLSDTLIKAEALRETQLNMLKGNVRVDDRKVILSNGESLSLPSTFPQGALTLSDPYFWSAFTLIGNWN